VPGAMVISPGADADFAIGNATIRAEVFDDIPDVAQILVPCGGGGLIVGIGYARAVRMSVRVVGVQLKESHHLCRLYTGSSGIIGDRATEVDSLAGDLEPEALAYAHIRRVCDEFRLVAEDEIRRATDTLSKMLQAPLDPGAGAGLAALGLGDAGITCLIVTGRER
jgi:threonine dehydratase